MEVKVIVFGLGKFGAQIGKTLAERRVSVLGVDRERKIIEGELKDILASTQCLDCSTEEGLEGVDLENTDVAVVAIGEDYEASTKITAFLKEKKHHNENMKNMKIIARAGDPAQARVLQELGPTRIVRVEEDAGTYVANLILSTGSRYIYIGPNGDSCKIKAENKKIVGKTLDELNFEKKFKVYIYRIVGKDGKEKALVPPADYKVEKGDILEMLGKSEDVNKLKKKFTDEITI